MIKTILKSSVCILMLALASCSSLQQVADIQKPAASISKVSFGSVSLDSITLLVDVEVANPNSMSLNAQGLDLDLVINEQVVAKVEKDDEKIALPANGTGSIELPFTLKFQELSALITNFSELNSVNYSLDGKVSLDLPVLGSIDLPVDYTDVLPIPKLPQISFKGLKLDAIDWSGATMTLDLDVTNPNSFNLDIESLAYQMASGDKEFTSGSIGSVSLEEGQTQNISLPLNVSLTNMGIKLFRLIYGGEAIDVNLSGSAAIVPGLDMWKPEDINFSDIQKLKP